MTMPASRGPRPAPSEAMTAWWKANRDTWAMDPPNALPADRPLNARQARRLAARLANEAFARVAFKTPAGQQIGDVTIDSEETLARQVGETWVWRATAARGPTATVTFDLRGGGAKVSIDYIY